MDKVSYSKHLQCLKKKRDTVKVGKLYHILSMHFWHSEPGRNKKYCKHDNIFAQEKVVSEVEKKRKNYKNR